MLLCERLVFNMSQGKRRIKKEIVDDDEMDQTPPKKNKQGNDADGPHPVALVLNSRGMPARIRKKNRLYINDDVVTPMTHHRSSPKKTPTTPKPTPPPPPPAPAVPPPPKEKKIKTEPTIDTFVAPDKRMAQRIGVRLRNLLKLPKAHKWVCYEWFYSNLDRPLFEGDNDFMTCLKESFPQLKTRVMTRVEWCKIRRMMGKPRRCSQSFFEEERRELERKRSKIRALQQRKATADVAMFKDLPDEIPLQLVIGTKVTARLRRPQDGLFSGSIDAVDTSNNTYRITFERQGLGTHSIPDYEVLSNETPETISMASLAARMRPRSLPATTPTATATATEPAGDAGVVVKTETPTPAAVAKSRAETAGGFPIRLLETLVRLHKILKVKQQRVNALRDMNLEAEHRVALGVTIPSDFVRRYAAAVVELDRLNVALSDFLIMMQDSCSSGGLSLDDSGSANAVAPSTLRQLSEEEARVVVNRQNESRGEHLVNSDRLLRLITSLTSIMLQLKGLVVTEGDNAFELKVLQETVERVRNSLSPSNLLTFHTCVESQLQHIQLGMGQRGMLAPFLSQRA